MSDGDGSDNATLLTIEQVGLCLATPDLEAPSSTQDHSSVVGHDFIGTDGINIVLKAASVPPNTSALLNPAPGVLPRAAGLAPGENLDVHDDMESEEEEGTGWDELGDTSAPSSQAAILLTPAYLPSAVRCRRYFHVYNNVLDRVPAGG